ncbi:MAG: prepilin-type N-terminal cleavage/methylation domain-containing protein [Zoogloeaceae bacterium]|jgi:prepilin-type N-terminal cleavage/methylation domain-containing protein|nr:prepilin-type N-terminal cleavage/methylation domain-containing protein [Zoogloeaceae bacterium]
MTKNSSPFPLPMPGRQPPPPSPQPSPTRGEGVKKGSGSSGAGFTLIELLVVCAILAALAVMAWGAYVDVDRRAEDELASVELLRLATALRRFHDDTGYWPGEGPFQLAGADCELSGGGAVKLEMAGEPPTDPALTDDERRQWFDSPANFSLLFERPSLCPNHPLRRLAEWSAEARRGWNGPYLPLANRLWLDAWQSLEKYSVAQQEVDNIPAFGAGPKFPARSNAPTACVSGDSGGCFVFKDLAWHTLPHPHNESQYAANGYDPDRHELARHARPFFFLKETRSEGESVPRVVYWGADGRYGGIHPTDPCKPNVEEDDGKDDKIICVAEGRTQSPPEP